MFHQDNDTELLPPRRLVDAGGLPRQRHNVLRERTRDYGHLSYALVLIFLFQTLLLSCVAVSLGALVLFSFANYITRNQEAEQVAIALTRMAPLVSNQVTPTALAATAAPTAAVALTTTTSAAPLPQASAPQEPTPTPPQAQAPQADTVSPLATPLDPAHPAPATNPPAQPAVSPELQTYANQLLPYLNGLSSAMNQLRGFAQNPNLDDQQWVVNVTAQINIIRNTHEQLKAMQPPPQMAEAHSDLMNTLNTCRAAADGFQNSIVNHAPANLNTAVTDTQNCFAQFPAAAQRLQEALQAMIGHS